MPRNSAAWLPAARTPLEVKEAPYASPKANEIVVENHAVAINPVDWLKAGKMSDMVYGWIKYPWILGSDLAGKVVEIGPDVSRFKVGDRVLSHAMGYAQNVNNSTKSAFQSYTVCLEYMTALIPDSMSYESASVVPLGASTAACSLFEKDQLNLQRPVVPKKSTGKTILVWGGSTSVGCNAIQLAVAAGYEVVVTCSPKNFDLCKRLGAIKCFDYNSKSVILDLIDALKGTSFAGAMSVGVNSDGPCFDIVDKCKSGKVVSMISYPSLQPEPQSLKLLRNIFFFAKWFFGTTIRSSMRGIHWKFVVASSIKDSDLGRFIYEDIISKNLADGTYVAVPEPEVVGHGLEHIQTAFHRQEQGMSASKAVVVL